MTEPGGSSRFPSIIIALAIVISAGLLALPLREMKASAKVMTVTGSATKQVSSDFVVWQCRLRIRGADLPTAYQSLMSARGRVAKYFRDKGVADSIVITQPVTTQPLKQQNPHGYGTTEEIIGYELVQSYKVSSGDIAFMLDLAENSTKLLEEGILFEADAPQFFYTKIEDLKLELIGDAAENASKRAGIIAGRTGSALGPPRSVRIGVFQVRPLHSTEVSDEGMLDTNSREKEAMAVVTITFGIE